MLGLSLGDLFLRDDLIKGFFEYLDCVSRTAIALIGTLKIPPSDLTLQDHEPHRQLSGLSRAAQPTPNLVQYPSPPLPFRDQDRPRAEATVPVPTLKNGSSPIPITTSPTNGALPPIHSSTPTIDDSAEVEVNEDAKRPPWRTRSHLTRVAVVVGAGEGTIYHRSWTTCHGF